MVSLRDWPLFRESNGTAAIDGVRPRQYLWLSYLQYFVQIFPIWLSGIISILVRSTPAGTLNQSIYNQPFEPSGNCT